ncbi:MAG: hypothetical protein JNJ77_19865 [Planctomycetia bacterium]|nr:hypothetical protein [Planctomycetia bacterium]
MERKNLKLSCPPGEILLFTVDQPCTFAVQILAGTQTPVLVHAPLTVNVQRGRIRPEIADEMAASIEQRRSAAA